MTRNWILIEEEEQNCKYLPHHDQAITHRKRQLGSPRAPQHPAPVEHTSIDPDGRDLINSFEPIIRRPMLAIRRRM